MNLILCNLSSIAELGKTIVVCEMSAMNSLINESRWQDFQLTSTTRIESLVCTILHSTDTDKSESENLVEFHGRDTCHIGNPWCSVIGNPASPLHCSFAWLIYRKWIRVSP